MGRGTEIGKGSACERPLHRQKHACSTNTSRHASSCRSRCRNLHRHKHACITRHKRARNRNPLRWRRPRLPLWPMSASLGGSLFCSWTCPEQGSHTVVLDGSLFKKEQGGHTCALEPHEAATACCPMPGFPTRPTMCQNRGRVMAAANSVRGERPKRKFTDCTVRQGCG